MHTTSRNAVHTRLVHLWTQNHRRSAARVICPPRPLSSRAFFVPIESERWLYLYFYAFSSREPVSTSLENALEAAITIDIAVSRSPRAASHRSNHCPDTTSHSSCRTGSTH